MSSQLRLDDRKVDQVLTQDDSELSVIVCHLLSSDEYIDEVLNLKNDDAENFMIVLLKVTFQLLFSGLNSFAFYFRSWTRDPFGLLTMKLLHLTDVASL